jgi:hypothetical protein
MEDSETLLRSILKRPDQPTARSRHPTRTLRRLVRFSPYLMAPNKRNRSTTGGSENAGASGSSRASKRVTKPTPKAAEAPPKPPTKSRPRGGASSASASAAKRKPKAAPPPPVPEPEPDPESEPEAGDKAEEEGGDDGQDEAQENNVDDDGNASDRSVVFLQDERRKAVPETSSKTPSRSTSRRKSAGPGLSLPPALPPPPKEFSIKITSQIDYLRNPTYTKAVKDRCEPFRPAGETAIYSVEVERDCFGPEGSDPDQLDDLMLGNSFKVTVKGILEEMLRLMKVDMPLCGVNYAISVHSTLLSVGWLNSRDNQLLEKQIRAPMPEVEPFGVIPAKEAIQALLRHYSNNPLTSGWYAKLTLNLILGPDPSPPAPEPLSTAQTNAAQSQQPAHIAYMAQNHPGVVMPTTTPGRNRNSTTNHMLRDLQARQEIDQQRQEVQGETSHALAFRQLINRWTCNNSGGSRGTCKAYQTGDKYHWCYYFDGSSEHFHITHNDLSEWAGAIRRKAPGVTVESPPAKLLQKWFTRGATDDGPEGIYNPLSQSRRSRGKNSVPNIYVVAGNNYHGVPGGSGAPEWFLPTQPPALQNRGYTLPPSVTPQPPTPPSISGRNSYILDLQQSIELPLRSSSPPIPPEDTVQRRDLIGECFRHFQMTALLGASNIPTRALLRRVQQAAVAENQSLLDLWRQPISYYTRQGLEESLVTNLKRSMKEYLKAECELLEDYAAEAQLPGPLLNRLHGT